jgi:hypothetical protein
VLGNQVTPIPVTLDGQQHAITIPLEAVAADASAGSTYTLQITDGTSVYFAARNAGLVNLSHISVSVPTVAPGASKVVTGITPSGAVKSAAFSCAAPSGRLAGRSLGPVSLGMTRARARRSFAHVSMRGQRYMDFFCPSHGGIRVGYPSPSLLRALSRHEARQVRGRVILLLTANRHYALKGIRPGARLTTARRRLHLDNGFQVGLNRWYLGPAGISRDVLKVRKGKVQEIGVANPTLTDKRLARRFLRSFS